jgi:hypothetical protein
MSNQGSQLRRRVSLGFIPTRLDNIPYNVRKLEYQEKTTEENPRISLDWFFRIMRIELRRTDDLRAENACFWELRHRSKQVNALSWSYLSPI